MPLLPYHWSLANFWVYSMPHRPSDAFAGVFLHFLSMSWVLTEFQTMPRPCPDVDARANYFPPIWVLIYNDSHDECYSERPSLDQYTVNDSSKPPLNHSSSRLCPQKIGPQENAFTRKLTSHPPCCDSYKILGIMLLCKNKWLTS